MLPDTRHRPHRPRSTKSKPGLCTFTRGAAPTRSYLSTFNPTNRTQRSSINGTTVRRKSSANSRPLVPNMMSPHHASICLFRGNFAKKIINFSFLSDFKSMLNRFGDSSRRRTRIFFSRSISSNASKAIVGKDTLHTFFDMVNSSYFAKSPPDSLAANVRLYRCVHT
jgi:hypothetical protein